MPRSRTALNGFTLIEIVIAIVIVGILAAIALPSYQGMIRKNNRGPAKTVLADLVTRQDGYRMQNRVWAPDLQVLKASTVTGATVAFVNRTGQLSSTQDSNSIYEIRMQAAAICDGTDAFVATAINRQLEDNCRSFLLCYNGAKDTQNKAGIFGSANADVMRECWG